MGYLCRSRYDVQRWGLDGKKPQRVLQCCALVPTGDIRMPGLSGQGRERLLEPGEGGLAGAGVSSLPPVGESRGVRTLPHSSLLSSCLVPLAEHTEQPQDGGFTGKAGTGLPPGTHQR